MAKIDIISDLGPGDKFLYNDTYYIIVSVELTHGLSYSMTETAYALDLDTYEIVPFNKSVEVEVLYYYGGI